jgi:aspartate carbamoyltransferase catalytic subunit
VKGTRSAPRAKPVVDEFARDLVGLQSLPRERLVGLLKATTLMKASLASRSGPKRTLAGRIVANLFFEDSTRTRSSFTTAAFRLGAEVLNLTGAASSVNKGETLIDTARNIESMGVDALVIRAKQSGAAMSIARAVACPVLNAGDGRHEHPTQGILDIHTLASALKRDRTFDLAGVRVAIVGDVVSSRVARSNIAGMTALGATVVCVGPPSLAPRSLESLAPGACEVSHDFDAVLPSVDAVMMLRVQFERHEEPAKAGDTRKPSPIASVREYRAFFGLTPTRTERMKRSAVVMHPGPINRGLEIDAEVADGPRSVILPQVATGVAARMAVLEDILLGG